MKFNLLIQKSDSKKFDNTRYIDCNIVHRETHELEIFDSNQEFLFAFFSQDFVIGLNEIFLYGHIQDSNSRVLSKAHIKLSIPI